MSGTANKPADELDDLNDTPWGWAEDVRELAQGVWRVSTPGHGGLRLDRERWEQLPDLVRDSFFNTYFAEEDCEEAIAMTLLGIGGERDRECAIMVADHFPRYAPALPYLNQNAPNDPVPNDPVPNESAEPALTE